jgi:hypothetical protein
MDIFTPTKKQVSHKLELYTQHLLVSGTVTTPFKRVSDALNKGDSQFLHVDDAVITPLGKPPAQKPIEGPAMVSLDHLHFVVEALRKKQVVQQSGRMSDDLEARSAYVQKDHYPCFAITGTYAITGYCYLQPGSTLDSLLRGRDTYVPITKATLHLVADTESSWTRELVVINRNMISAMYLTP